MSMTGERTPLPPGLVRRAVEGVRYIITGVTPATWFGPSQPLAPMAPADVAGRQLDYPVGYNLTVTPRSEERITFAQLRALADGYDLLRTVIETRKDQLERLQWSIRPRSGARADDPRIVAIEAFFRRPDGVQFWSTWLRQLLEDLFVVDAPALYVRRNRAGGLFALELIDGTTIKRLIDADGRTPRPPDPAYQQVLHGLPAVDFTTDELIYRPRNPRPHKLYGYSPVEQVAMTVNIALRRQLHQLSYYTEGNVPEALIGTPESWTPSQIKEFQQYWDALLEGNLGQRRHAKFVPGGVAKTFIPTKEVELKSAYDEWLARVICFAFSISPQAFSDHMNRATAETAQDTALAEGLAPIQSWVKQLVDGVIASEFGAADLEFQWRDDGPVDATKQASIAQIYVTNGIKTINEARADIGLAPVEGGDAPLIFTGSGPVPLSKIGDLGKVFNPGQLRVPKGNPGGGQWTADGGSLLQPTGGNLVGRRPYTLGPQLRPRPGETGGGLGAALGALLGVGIGAMMNQGNKPGDKPNAKAPPQNSSGATAASPGMPDGDNDDDNRGQDEQDKGRSQNQSDNPRQYKEKTPGLSGKEAADDPPSWARGNRPYVDENGKSFARRLLDDRYGKGNWEREPNRLKDYNRIKKWGDRAFRNPVKKYGDGNSEECKLAVFQD